MTKKVTWLALAKTVDSNGVIKNIDDVMQPLPAFDSNENGYNWIHLSAKCHKTKQFLTNKLKLERVWISALTAPESRPRFIKITDDSFFINLRGINFIDNNEAEDMISLRLYVTKNMVISTKIYDLKAMGYIENDFKNNEPPLTSARFISRIIEYINKDIEAAIFSIHEEVDNLEEMSLVEHDKDFRQNVIGIRRQMIIFRRYLRPNQEALKNLCVMKNFYHQDDELYDHLIESEHKMTRFIEESHSIKERGQVIHEELTNHLTEQLNASTNKLSLVATIFLPMTFITGLFGVNLAGIPFAENSSAFMYFTLIIVALFFTALGLFKLLKWF